ncbi:MAG: alpha-E domain-containing protein [Isosphaeraceae bacterium]
MLSRVAENLYWMSRYVERAENIARLLDVAFDLELDAAGLHDGLEASPVIGVMSILNCRSGFLRKYGDIEPSPEQVLRYLTFDRQNSLSILAMVARARENARSSQEAVGSEVWSHVNRLYLYLISSRAQRRFTESPSRFYNGLKRSCVLFAGLIDSTLPHNEVYHFLRSGRYLERVGQIGRVLADRAHQLRPDAEAADLPLQLVHCTSLLRICSAYDAYLRTYHDRIDPECVVQYLVLEDAFPRSIRFSVECCRNALQEISGSNPDAYGSESERLLGRLEGELRP